MNILFVADVGTEKISGGAERALAGYVNSFIGKAHGVHVLSRDSITSGVCGRDERFLIRSVCILKSLCILLFYLRSLLKKSRPDLINFHQPFSALFVLLHPSAHRIPKIYTFHSSAAQEYATRILRSYHDQSEKKFTFWERLNVLFRKKIERYSLRKSQCVIVLSEFSRRILCNLHQIPPPEVVLIPGGTDVDRFRPAQDHLGIREKLAPGFTRLLFTVRNLVPRMGLANMIRSMVHVVEQHPNTLLIIGGEGPLRNELITLTHQLRLEKNIRFEGFIPEEDLPRYYQAADLFVLPTERLEGFGLVTVEALACGTPVVGTPVGGTVEVLGNLDDRLLCEGVQPHHLASRINFFLAHPDELEAIRKKCRSYAVRHYDWKQIATQLEKVFEKHVRENPCRSRHHAPGCGGSSSGNAPHPSLSRSREVSADLDQGSR